MMATKCQATGPPFPGPKLKSRSRGTLLFSDMTILGQIGKQQGTPPTPSYRKTAGYLQWTGE